MTIRFLSRPVLLLVTIGFILVAVFVPVRRFTENPPGRCLPNPMAEMSLSTEPQYIRHDAIFGDVAQSPDHPGKCSFLPNVHEQYIL